MMFGRFRKKKAYASVELWQADVSKDVSQFFEPGGILEKFLQLTISPEHQMPPITNLKSHRLPKLRRSKNMENSTSRPDL